MVVAGKATEKPKSDDVKDSAKTKRGLTLGSGIGGGIGGGLGHGGMFYTNYYSVEFKVNLINNFYYFIIFRIG